MGSQYKKLINLSVWSTIVVFVIRCGLSWESIVEKISIYDLFGYAGESIGIAAIISALYEKFLWRINPIEKTPKLKNTYSGTIRSSYDNVEREAVLKVRQSLLSLNVTLITAESKSNSISASIDNILGENQLTYCFLNTPKSEFRKSSEIHYGTAILSLNDPNHISGQYYTDRKTIGDMAFDSKE